METRCYGCGKSNPQLLADYAHFQASFCDRGCQERFHLETKHKNRDGDESDDKKKSRKQRVKDSAKKAGETVVKHGKTAGKVAKVVAPLVILKPYTDSGTEDSEEERGRRESMDSGTESY